MKSSDLSKVIGASVMAAGLVILPATLPASAQSNTSPNTDSTTTTTTTPRADVYDADIDNDFDWGWLGLLGLTGLLGLIPRKQQETVHYNSTTSDRDPVRTDYR